MALDGLFFRLVTIYLAILIGIVFKKITRRISFITKAISFILINILVPLVVFSAILQFNQTIKDIRFFLASVSIFLFSSVLAILFSRFSKIPSRIQGPLILLCINTNYIYLPFPIINSLNQAEGLAYSSLFIFTANLVTVFSRFHRNL